MRKTPVSGRLGGRRGVWVCYFAANLRRSALTKRDAASRLDPIGSDQIPVYESGIANLTKHATPILVHTGNGQLRQVTLIRLEQPAQ